MVARFLAIGLGLLVMTVVVAACGSPSPTSTPSPSPTPTVGQEPNGGDLGRSLVAQEGCTACHSIDGSSGVGPTLKGLFGATKSLADGSTVTADEVYLRQSIVDPGAKITEGFSAGLMPTRYGTSLSGADVTAILEYIKTLK